MLNLWLKLQFTMILQSLPHPDFKINAELLFNQSFQVKVKLKLASFHETVFRQIIINFFIEFPIAFFNSAIRRY